MSNIARRAEPATTDNKLADKRPVVQLHQIECRHCDFLTVRTEDEAAVYQEQDDHFTETGHPEFWKYDLTRGRGRTETFRT